MARELTLTDLEQAGVRFVPWAEQERRNLADIISIRQARVFVDKETCTMFERHCERSKVLKDLARNCLRFRIKHGL